MSPVTNKIVIMHFDCSGEKFTQLGERRGTSESPLRPAAGQEWTRGKADCVYSWFWNVVLLAVAVWVVWGFFCSVICSLISLFKEINEKNEDSLAENGCVELINDRPWETGESRLGMPEESSSRCSNFTSDLLECKFIPISRAHQHSAWSRWFFPLPQGQGY